MKILVVNGPNRNFLGIREVSVYGTADFDYLRQLIHKKCAQDNILCRIFQSNHEGEIIDRLQDAYRDNTDAIIINPGAYAHYSYAIHDAITSIQIPTVEVHISDIEKREEEWRHKSVTAPACVKVIKGKGLDGYIEAIDFLKEYLNQPEE